MENYVSLSIETHLFFARIMKEHSLFLEAGFPCKDEAWIQRADRFRQQFENLLREVLRISNGRVRNSILTSNELVTEFTIPAENRTEALSGVSIDSRLSTMTQNLTSGHSRNESREMIQEIHDINERSIHLIKNLIDFKEDILRETKKARLFNANYPLLIKHIIREAKLYCSTIEQLMNDRRISYKDLMGTEAFWNQIMMEHALFIRGLLDPSENELIMTADQFALDYKRLLEAARAQDCRATEALTGKTLAKTKEYQKFKSAGAKGILECRIASIILPLLADHVLREANHYIRILENEYRG